MEEHGKVSALIMRVKMTTDPDKRRELYPTIRRELLAHETGELTVVYPELAKHAETSKIAAMHSAQASELQAAIASLDALSFADAGWASGFERLSLLVEEHVKLEESDFFPKGQKAIGDKRAEALVATFEAAKHH